MFKLFSLKKETEPGRIAKSAKHLTEKPKVAGSRPSPATYFCEN